jgi:hypothetical protein
MFDEETNTAASKQAKVVFCVTDNTKHKYQYMFICFSAIGGEA